MDDEGETATLDGTALGDDIWRSVLEHLDEPASIVALSAACRRFHSLAPDWFAYCRVRFRVDALEESSVCLCGHSCSGSSSKRCCRCTLDDLAPQCAELRHRCAVCAEQQRLARLRPSVQRLLEAVAAERASRWALERAADEAAVDAVGRHWHALVAERMAGC